MSAYQGITNRIIELIESKQALPWKKPWHSVAPVNAVSNRRYRGINRLVLSAQEFFDPRFLTFKQALELGGHVRKGQRGTSVAFWRFPDEQEQQLKQVPKVICRQFTVFNVEQCDGLGLPPVQQHNQNVDALEAVTRMIDGFSNRPKIVFTGERAFYSSKFDLIHVPPAQAFESCEAFFQTTAHECSHSVWHPDRLNEPSLFEGVEFGSAPYAFGELVAEISASFLCGEFEISNQTPQSAAYVKSWLRALKNNPAWIVKAAAKAEKAADYILGRTEEKALSPEEVAA